MPQPIKRDIEVYVEPGAVSKRPELAVRIAAISSFWTQIEDEIATAFAVGLHAPLPALAAAALGRINNLKTRLDMIETILSLIAKPMAEEWRNHLSKEILKRASERSNVLHCVWIVHDDYPGELLHSRGLADPKLTLMRWTLEDFLALELRMVELLVKLKQFLQTLVAYVQANQGAIEAWIPSAPPQE